MTTTPARLLVLLATLTVLVGCQRPARPADDTPDLGSTPGGTSSSSTPVPPPLQAATALAPDAVDKAVARIDDLAGDLLMKSGVPGMAVAVVHGGKTVYAKGFGVKDVRRGEAADNQVDPDTVFQLASLSKSLGATVVAQQVGAKKVGWDTPIVDKLPWFGLSDPAVTRMVTVADMYAHRSGLPDHAGDLLEELGYDRRTILERLRSLPLAPFRASYAYTNFGLTAGAEAVAAAAGVSWEDLSQSVLYGPLGMASTSSRMDAYLARPDRAVGHIQIDDRYQPRFVRDASAQSPAGGVSSSVNDMARWLSMMLADGTFEGRRVVDPAALLPALTPQSVASPPTTPAARSGFYGYGFDVGTTADARMQFSHSGAFELGAATNFVILPSADVAIVALTNATPAGVPETLTAQFADLVQFGEIRNDWYPLYNDAFRAMEKPLGSLVGRQPPAAPAPAAPLPTYAGLYDNPYWGPARVTLGPGGLNLALGPKLSVPLKHWDGNVFTFDLISENAPPGTVSKATFNGNRLTLEYFDQDRTGTFTR